MLASASSIIAIITTIIQGAQIAIKAGHDAMPFIEMLKKLFKKDSITIEDIEKIEIQLADLHSRIQQPLFPEED